MLKKAKTFDIHSSVASERPVDELEASSLSSQIAELILGSWHASDHSVLERLAKRLGVGHQSTFLSEDAHREELLARVVNKLCDARAAISNTPPAQQYSERDEASNGNRHHHQCPDCI